MPPDCERSPDQQDTAASLAPPQLPNRRLYDLNIPLSIVLDWEQPPPGTQGHLCINCHQHKNATAFRAGRRDSQGEATISNKCKRCLSRLEAIKRGTLPAADVSPVVSALPISTDDVAPPLNQPVAVPRETSQQECVPLSSEHTVAAFSVATSLPQFITVGRQLINPFDIVRIDLSNPTCVQLTIRAGVLPGAHQDADYTILVIESAAQMLCQQLGVASASYAAPDAALRAENDALRAQIIDMQALVDTAAQEMEVRLRLLRPLKQATNGTHVPDV